jgi:hypothetical protein
MLEAYTVPLPALGICLEQDAARLRTAFPDFRSASP